MSEQTKTNSPEALRAEMISLLAACTLKDQQAFTKLYDLTSAKLYGVILRILVRDEWAQDCLQEAFIKVWNNAESYRPDLAAPMTWMATIARNQALDLLRRKRREISLEEATWLPEEADSDPLPLDRLQHGDDAKRLAECLEGLKPQQRQTIALAYFKGLTHEQLATHMESPLGTIKTWIRRGLEQLKRCLEP